MADMGQAMVGMFLMMMGFVVSLTGFGLCCGAPIMVVGLSMAVSGVANTERTSGSD
jgi:hypothetical protein